MSNEQRLTPRELAMKSLGYIPEGTPLTWEEVEQINLNTGHIIYVNGSALNMKGTLARKILQDLVSSGEPLEIKLPHTNSSST